MGVKGVWILQKGLYEGTETCQKGLYVCVFVPLRQYKEKSENHSLPGDVCKISRDCWKNHKAVDTISREIKPH
jgi:hypothetical protein